MYRWALIAFLIGLTHASLFFAADGDPDLGFGDQGRIIIDFFGRTDVGSHLLVGKDDKIILAGSATKNIISDHFALIRYNKDGSLDESFGIEGRVLTREITEKKIVDGGIMGMDALSDGRIIACGRGLINGTKGFSIVSYQENGTLDKTFAGDGAAIFPDIDQEIYPLALTVDTRDRIIMAASSFDRSRKSSSFAVFRINLNGRLDESFGEHGKVITPIVNGINVPRALKVDHENNIVVGGFNGNNKFVVIKYFVDGSIDKTFGEDGIATIYFNPDGIDTLHALTIDPTGRILIGGDVQVSSIGGIRAVDFGLARLLKEGTLDTSFNHTGKLITSFEKPAASTLWALTLQDDGKIIAVGDASIVKGLAIARVHDDGSLDESFGKLGKLIIPFGNTSHWEAVALDSNQRIVVGGYVWNGKHFDMALMRFINKTTSG